MSDFAIRTLTPDEHRASSALFRGTLHIQIADDTDWERSKHAFQDGRALGAFDPELIGVTRSFDAELTVPGGAKLPLAGVTAVGVRADRTRRGVMRALLTTQLEDFAARGVTFAALLASEAVIYPRFGYGLASQCRTYSVDRHRARLRDTAPASGEITLYDLDTALEKLPEIYAGLELGRPGSMSRPQPLWGGYAASYRRQTEAVRTIVHRGPDGIDGYATFHVENPGHRGTRTLHVPEMFWTTSAAFAGLWRFLLGIDLVDVIKVGERPLDEPIEHLLADHRRVTNDEVGDEHWLRIVDVPTALEAREYGRGEPVVIEVTDSILPANNGRYRISEAGVTRTGEPAALRFDADTLAMVYLGTWRPSALATAGRIEVRDPAAPAAADRLFATTQAAWFGTYF